jgi:hypothetical protein
MLAGALALACIAPPSAFAASPPSGPDPAVLEWPRWPYQATCGYLAFDPVSVFSGPTEAELGSSPPETALRAFLERREIPWVKPRFWRLVAEDETTAEFVHGRLVRGLEWVAFELQDGKWKFVSYSSNCHPTSIVGRGTVVTWDLAPQEKPLRKWVRRVRVNLGPGNCSGGRSQNKRARPVFQPLGNKLLMTIRLTPLPPGVYTCPGLVEPPLTVRLPRRMRLSRLLDGGTYPPRPALGR